jgi:signal transduction histidine kinase
MTPSLVSIHPEFLDYATVGTAAYPASRPETFQNTPSFAQALVHEVRNPVTNINLAVELLRAALTKNDQLESYFDIILRSTKRINEVVSDFFVNPDILETHCEKYSMEHLLDEALELTSDRIKLKKISVVKEYHGGHCNLSLNGAKVKIALANIILNAIEAMNCEKGKLKLVTRSVENRFIIHIQDNGCGISRQNLENIFKPLFTTKGDGLGMGLPATFEILQANQVEVTVRSKVNFGTRFILSIHIE